eukprot:2580923-Pleurochrysis_carterae.AAC.5
MPSRSQHKLQPVLVAHKSRSKAKNNDSSRKAFRIATTSRPLLHQPVKRKRDQYNNQCIERHQAANAAAVSVLGLCQDDR